MLFSRLKTTRISIFIKVKLIFVELFMFFITNFYFDLQSII